MSITDSIPLSLGETIGSLMTSVIDAQAQAARATVDFIEDVGTEAGSGDLGAVHDLRTLSFKYKKLDENFESKDFVLEIPLLSMVDIPMVAVKSAKFSFNYQITKTTPQNDQAQAHEDLDSEEKANPTIDNKKKSTLPMARAPRIEGRFKPVKKDNSTPSQVSTSAQETGGLDVTIEFEKASMPVGIDRILEALELASAEKKVDDKSDA